MSVCLFNSLPNAEYSNVLIVAAFSKKSFAGKTSLPVKNSCLSTFPDDKAEILAEISFIYLNFIELCFAQFCYQFF